MRAPGVRTTLLSPSGLPDNTAWESSNVRFHMKIVKKFGKITVPKICPKKESVRTAQEMNKHLMLSWKKKRGGGQCFRKTVGHPDMSDVLTPMCDVLGQNVGHIVRQ